MQCWHCKSELIWDSDFDAEQMDVDCERGIITSLHCPNCPATVEVTLPIPDTNPENIS
jgi:hypothetical protein